MNADDFIRWWFRRCRDDAPDDVATHFHRYAGENGLVLTNVPPGLPEMPPPDHPPAFDEL